MYRYHCAVRGQYDTRKVFNASWNLISLQRDVFLPNGYVEELSWWTIRLWRILYSQSKHTRSHGHHSKLTERGSGHTLPSLTAPNRQHVFVQTTQYTAFCIFCSSTFIHYQPLYLHVAPHWFSSNVSAWRQVNPPFGFQCSNDGEKKKGDVTDGLTQSGPVIKACRPLEVSRSRIPSSPSITTPTAQQRIRSSERYQGWVYAEPKMGWRFSYKNIFRVTFSFC